MKFQSILNFLFLIITVLFISCDIGDSGSEELEDETNDLYGVWVRTNGPSGDETEIAIGGISGEPEKQSLYV